MLLVLYRHAVVLWLILLGVACAAAQQPLAVEVDQAAAADSPDPTAPPTAAEIDRKIESLEARTDVDEATAGSIKDLYQSAKQSLAVAELQRAEATRLATEAAEAAANLRTVEEQLAESPAAESPSAGRQSAQLQAELAEKTAELSAARSELERLTAEPGRRQARLAEIPKLIQAAERRSEKLEQQIEQLSDQDGPLVADARAAQLRADLIAAEQEMAALQAEHDYYTAASELLPLQQKTAERRIDRLETEVDRWQQAIAAERTSEIDRLSEAADSLIAQAPPALQAAAELNQQLVTRYREIAERLATANRESAAATAKLQELQRDFETAKSRVEAVGLNDTLGLMLRRTKSMLDAMQPRFRVDRAAGEELKELQVGLFELQDFAAAAADNDAATETLLATAGVPRQDYSQWREVAEQILAQRRTILAKLAPAQSQLFNQLLDLDQTQREILATIDEFISFINQHILWIRSGPVIWKENFGGLVQAVQWVLHRENGSALVKAALTAIRDALGLFLVLVSALALLITFRIRLRGTIDAASQQARSDHCRSFVPTAEALTSTILIAVFWPFLFLSAGWLLADASNDEFVRGTARCLIWISLAVFPLELVRQVCRRGGLASDHFQWPPSACRFANHHLSWFNPLLASLLFVVCLLQHQPNESYRNSLGRLTLMILLTVVGAYVLQVLRPSSGMYRGGADWQRGAVWYRFRRLLFSLAAAIVVTLLMLTVTGYYYSAYQIGSRLLQTWALLIGFGLSYALATRWLLVRRRRVHIDRLTIRRQEIRKQPEVEQAFGKDVKIELKPETGPDIADISRQGKQLFLILLGFVAVWIAWRIWQDVIPAVAYLTQFQLWSVTESGVKEWVTWAHVASSLLALAITLFAVKNLPGILELLLLNRLPIDAGARYAVVTIARYIVTIVGVAIACTIIKIPWSQLGWLVAAISVGLGFGLQEIVANFVSGLILLLERPVRVGDIVTIEGTTGVISRIQMRATTVTNWDQQELVVPNKNLITNSIVNWTLSNVVTRLTIPVGVAYSSDAERVHQVITEVVTGHPDVLEDPQPIITFESFGDSSLNFVIRCCVSGLDRRLPTTNSLHVAIHQRLAAEGIEIPFPQRDVHLISGQQPKWQTDLPNRKPDRPDFPVQPSTASAAPESNKASESDKASVSDKPPASDKASVSDKPPEVA